MATASSLDDLLGRLRALIQDARRQSLRAVDAVQVRTCWEAGRYIVEVEQGGANHAEYGARLLNRLAERLTADFGKGFDVSSLRYMRLFYQAFPNCDALRSTFLTTEKDGGNSNPDTTPGSFGERARGRSERNGPCIFRGYA